MDREVIDMLYDELVPQGDYIAHYGVPKEQWSAEAKAKHRREHPEKPSNGSGKTILPIAPIDTARRLYEEYQDYQQEQRNERRRRRRDREPGAVKPGDYGPQLPLGGQKPGDSRRPNNPQKSGGKNRTVGPYRVTEGHKSNPELENVVQQLNNVQRTLNNRSRPLASYSHNGSLFKQNTAMNNYLDRNGLLPNTARVVTKSGNKTSGGKTNSGKNAPRPAGTLRDRKPAGNGSSTSSPKKPDDNRRTTSSTNHKSGGVTRTLASDIESKRRRAEEANNNFTSRGSGKHHDTVPKVNRVKKRPKK